MYRIQLDHLASVTKVKFEMEKLTQEQRLFELKQDLERKKAEHKKEMEHDEFMAEKSVANYGQQGFSEFWHKKCQLQMVGQENTVTIMIQTLDSHFSLTLHLIYHDVFQNYNATLLCSLARAENKNTSPSSC